MGRIAIPGDVFDPQIDVESETHIPYPTDELIGASVIIVAT